MRPYFMAFSLRYHNVKSLKVELDKPNLHSLSLQFRGSDSNLGIIINTV